jgi:hypothetical protein
MKFGECRFGVFRSYDSVPLLVQPPRENGQVPPIGLDKKHARAPFLANSFNLRIKRHRRASNWKWLTRR